MLVYEKTTRIYRPDVLVKKLYAHILLDRSGSMESCRNNAVDAVNEYANGLKVDLEVDARISLTLFDTMGIDVIRKAIPAHDFKKLTRDDFVPRSGTNLYDAIGATVTHMDGVRTEPGEAVALVIMTDGYENSSKEHTAQSIKKLLDDRKATKDWLVVYLGANQDAIAAAGVFGGNFTNTMNYSVNKMGEAMSSVVGSTLRYAKADDLKMGIVASGFTDEERNASK